MTYTFCRTFSVDSNRQYQTIVSRHLKNYREDISNSDRMLSKKHLLQSFLTSSSILTIKGVFLF